MKKYLTLFIIQLIIIGFSTNVHTDIPFWKQVVAYCLIACVLPIVEWIISFRSSKQ